MNGSCFEPFPRKCSGFVCVKLRNRVRSILVFRKHETRYWMTAFIDDLSEDCSGGKLNVEEQGFIVGINPQSNVGQRPADHRLIRHDINFAPYIILGTGKDRSECSVSPDDYRNGDLSPLTSKPEHTLNRGLSQSDGAANPRQWNLRFDRQIIVQFDIGGIPCALRN